ncbi:hypothetical protein DVH24_008363 [Malus domestica]|uniref:Zinc finger RING-H2-type domain-containing protein n=1 Tax=Malus domestica TaxID=3750 RepID=A0A498JPS2_MALDO|nr:hypothetical protein DVH24_008363 [Malus domestica]
MPSDGNKEEEGDEDVIILCSTDVEQVILGGETERKFTQNLSRRTAHSTRFRRNKRGTEHLVPLRLVPSHVPNGTKSPPISINWSIGIARALNNIIGRAHSHRNGTNTHGVSKETQEAATSNAEETHRKQCNCGHVFHWECLDSWVDQGQATCPLSRAMLFPPAKSETSCGGNAWTTETVQP